MAEGVVDVSPAVPAGAVPSELPPPRPSAIEIPGVVGEVTEDPEYISDVPGHIERQKQEAKAKKEAEAAPAGEEAKPEDGKPGEEKPKEEAPAKFTFGGVEFESQEVAEQQFKTLRGQYKGMQTREKAAAQRAQEQTVSALAWKAEAEQAQAELERLQAGEPGSTQRGRGDEAAAQPKDGGAEDGLMESVDWALYERLHEDHGPKVAAAWLSKQVVANVMEQVKGYVEPRLAPIDERAASAQEVEQMTQVFNAARTYVGPDGQAFYPELNDAEAAREVGFILGNLELPPQDAYSAKGVHLAVAVYRDRVRGRGGNGAGGTIRGANSGANASGVSAQVAAAGVAANAAASGAVTGAQPPSFARSSGQPVTEQAKLLAEIRNAGNPRANLGFSE